MRISSYEDPRYDSDRKDDVKVGASTQQQRSTGGEEAQIIGSSDVFDEYGNIKLIPVCGFKR